MACIQSRFSRLFRPNQAAARQLPAPAVDAPNVAHPAAHGGHARHAAARVLASGADAEELPNVPKPPPRTPARAPYSPPQATPSKVYQQPRGYRFGDSQKAIVENDGEPSIEDKLSDQFSAPVAKKGIAEPLAMDKTQASQTASVTGSVRSVSATLSKKSPDISDEEKSLLNNPTTGRGYSSDDTEASGSMESSSCETRAQMSQLEVDAFKAVQELGLFVKSISVSEVLARTPELLFLNLVTLEGNTYCVELTQRGWRICSDRADAANCDASLEVHAKYFETIHALLGDVSPTYRDRFGVVLS